MDSKQSSLVRFLFDPQQMEPEIPLTANDVQVALGAKQPDDGGSVLNILSQRFQPTLNDSSNALLRTMMSGKLSTAEDEVQERENSYVKQLATLGTLQKLSRTNSGGATGELIDRLRLEDPNLSFRDALYQVQTGFRQGTTFDKDGNIITMGGYPEAKEAIKYAESSGTQAGKLGYAAPIAEATALGKAQGEFGGQQAKNMGNAQMNQPVIERARELLPKAGGGDLSAAGMRAKQFFGISDEQTKANRQLKLLSSKLTAAVPRFEGPQGVLDVQLYQQAAGDIGNELVPYQDRLAALDTIIDLNDKYYGEGEPNNLPSPTQNTPNYQPPSLNGWSIELAD